MVVRKKMVVVVGGWWWSLGGWRLVFVVVKVEVVM
jgi:hypothetical protein